MILLANEEKKDAVVQSVIELTPKIVRMKRAVGGVIIVSILLAVIYLVLNILIPSMGSYGLRGEIVKDWYSIIGITATIIVVGLFVAIVLHFIQFRMVLPDLMERVDERIETDDTSMYYLFRIRYHSDSTRMVVFRVDYSKIESVEYDRDKSKLVLRGRFASTIDENFDGTIRRRPEVDNQEEIIIYDYFEPSLYQFLQNNTNII